MKRQECLPSLFQCLAFFIGWIWRKRWAMFLDQQLLPDCQAEAKGTYRGAALLRWLPGVGGKCLAPPAEQGWAGRGQLALSSSPEAPWCSLAWRAASQHPSTCPSDKTFVWSKAFQLLSAPHYTFSYFFLSGPLGVGMSEIRVQELRLVGGLSPTLRAPGGSLRGRPWGVRVYPRNRSTSE